MVLGGGQVPFQSTPPVSKKQGDIDSEIFVAGFEFEGIRFMEQIGIKQDDAVLRTGNNHFSTIVFGEELPYVSVAILCIGIIVSKLPVQWSLFLVYNQAAIIRVQVC